MLKSKGFTLIELLVVIAIIGILSSALMVTTIRGLEQSRDARRIQELYQIAQGLNLYRSASVLNQYPIVESAEINCNKLGAGWDSGNIEDQNDNFLSKLVTEGFLSTVPKEWKEQSVNGRDCVYRYSRVENPCNGACQGTYAILFGACEAPFCPVGERPACCTTLYPDLYPDDYAQADDKYDIAIFLKEE